MSRSRNWLPERETEVMQPFSMHGPQLFAGLWLSAVGLCVLCFTAVCIFDTDHRAANLRVIRNAFQGNNGGWYFVSMTFKMIGFMVPTVEHHVPWLWIVPLVLAALGWVIRRNRRHRLSETAYTRSMRRNRAQTRAISVGRSRS